MANFYRITCVTSLAASMQLLAAIVAHLPAQAATPGTGTLALASLSAPSFKTPLPGAAQPFTLTQIYSYTPPDNGGPGKTGGAGTR